MAVLSLSNLAKLQAWRWRILAGVLIFLAGCLHLVYFACACPLDLAPDEAHYWDWSRHLDWSYYSKGPLVAYLIRGSCALFGSWSQALIGNDMLAVRLPAILCGSLLLVSLYLLTLQVYGRDGLALAVVALALTIPVLVAGASLMTIDSPYTCCWGWALVAGHRAVFRGSIWVWVATGLLVGLGTLAKYTMVLWPASLVLFLMLTHGQRQILCRPGFWVMVLAAALCCLPILLWNARHDWVSFRHVTGQAGMQPPSGVRWVGPLAYLASQAGLLLGFWFVAWLGAMIAHHPGKETDPGVRYLWWLSAPTFTIFLLFSLKTPEEPNWPVGGYLSGLVLTVAWVSRQVQSPRPAYRCLSRICLGCACAVGLGLTLLMHRSDLAQPVLLRISGPASRAHPLPLRRFDPTCRLRGWRYLAQQVDAVREQLRLEGKEAVLTCSGWTLPGEVRFYCQGRPPVYSLGPALGDRHSQYDFWRPNPIADGKRFEGQTFIFIGEFHPILRRSFSHIGRSQTVTYTEGGQPVAQWCLTVCRGFRGRLEVVSGGW
jgi:hypothetical protein